MLQSLKTAAGLDPQLLHPGAARLAVSGERLRLPSRPVQRQHPVLAQPLTERLLFHERLELADELVMPSELEPGLDPRLQGRPAQLLQPGELARRRRQRNV